MGKDVIIDLQNDKIQAWQRHNMDLTLKGYRLETLFFDDQAPEFWAVRDDERIRNDPPSG